jgi:hypothetical protein
VLALKCLSVDQLTLRTLNYLNSAMLTTLKEQGLNDGSLSAEAAWYRTTFTRYCLRTVSGLPQRLRRKRLALGGQSVPQQATTVA